MISSVADVCPRGVRKYVRATWVNWQAHYDVAFLCLAKYPTTHPLSTYR